MPLTNPAPGRRPMLAAALSATTALAMLLPTPAPAQNPPLVAFTAIVADLSGTAREHLAVADLIALFSRARGAALDQDNLLL